MYRDDLEAAAERAETLARELAEARAENQRLKDAAALSDPGRTAELAKQLTEAQLENQRLRDQTLRSDGERQAHDALAKGERKHRAQDQRTQEQQRAAIAARPAASLRWFRMAASRFGFTQSGWFYYGIIMAVVLLAVPLGAISISQGHTPWLTCGALLLAGLLIAAGLIAAGRAGDDAEVWLAGLPFRATDLVDAFGTDWWRITAVAVHVEWADGPPSPELLVQLVGGAAVFDAQGQYFRMTLRETNSNLEANRRLYLQLRRLIDGVLMPLHRQQAIARISIEKSK